MVVDVSGSGRSDLMFCIVGKKISKLVKHGLKKLEKISRGSRILDAGADDILGLSDNIELLYIMEIRNDV